jgi:3-deoxy-D-manno-octulosonate 8-phosphate phosphatase (KDO 8-P phosphatase)
VDRVVTDARGRVVRLGPAEARRRAARTRLVLTDCDGVLTDGGVYVSERGEELKRFSLRDGMGVERLRAAGVATVIVSRERSPIVARRAEKLGVRVFEGVLDKVAALPGILAECRATADVAAYIGDDLNDLAVMVAVAATGLTAAPADAEPQVLAVAHLTCARAGGAGAFRELAEWILSERSPEEPPPGSEMEPA